MPWEIHKNDDKFCVHKKGSSNPIAGGCHSTREEAIRHMRALYANVPEGKMSENVLVSLGRTFAEEGNIVWLEALPAKTWHTDLYGEVPITVDKLTRMVQNFKENIRGQEIATNFEHGMDRAKGSKASGWFRDFKIAPSALDPSIMSLHAAVEFTEEAKAELADKQWQYFSMEWEDKWTHPVTKQDYEDVIVGGGLTNRPVAKGMVPINFSEVWEEATQFAASKPYGNVTYADPGYQADNKKRYPLDTEKHIRAAWSYINMPKNAKKYSSNQLARIKGKIKSALKRIGANVTEMSEVELMPETELEGPVATVPELELAEPGTNMAPAEELVGDISGGAEDGNRVDTPPIEQEANVDEGGVMDDLDKQLRELLELDGEADIVERVTEMKGVAEPLEKVAVEMSEQKAFAERYPEEAAELKRLREESVDRGAKAFAESCGKMRFTLNEEKTDLGFSALALEKIEGMHKKFSEGTATLGDFEDVLATALGSDGIVDFSETGSNQTDDLILDNSNPRMAFHELVKKIVDESEGKMEFAEAVQEATKRNPDLAKAYRDYKPAA